MHTHSMGAYQAVRSFQQHSSASPVRRLVKKKQQVHCACTLWRIGLAVEGRAHVLQESGALSNGVHPILGSQQAES